MHNLSLLSSQDFNWPLACTLSQACKLAYGRTEVFERILRRGWEADRCTFVSSGTCRIHYVEAGSAQMLVFADSAYLGEWLAAISSLDQRAPFGTGEVLSQVSQGYLAIRKALWELLSSHSNKAGSTLWLTGHGVGGALAMMAAADFVIEEHPFTGLVSLGNPRFVDTIFKEWFMEVMNGRCVSLINAEDLLPKIPSGWKHPSHSIVFDPHGTSKSTQNHQHVNSLPKKDWDVLHEQIRDLIKLQDNSNENKDKNLLRMDITSCALMAGLQDLAPSLNFNSIDRYSARIRRRIPNNSLDQVTLREAESCMASLSNDRGIMASSLVLSVEGFSQNFGNPQAIHVSDNDGFSLPVLIQLNETAWTAPEYVQKSTCVGAYVSALVPAANLELLQKDSNVNAIVVSRESCAPDLDLSVPFVMADQIHRPPIAEAGDHALVGIIDHGIDVRHQAFTNRSGHTRILGIWDQGEASGPSPATVDPTFSQNYGTLYTQNEIEAMRNGTSSIPSRLLSTDICAHGTHVAGIAAGRAVGMGADGMAPEAGILLVMPKLQAPEGSPQSIGYSMSHIDAAAFLIRAAQGANMLVSERLPIAVNMSMGMQAGPHDGMSVLETFLDTLTAKGTTSGCVIIKSAGNDHLSHGHARINLSHGQEYSVTWVSTEGDRYADYIEAWYDSDDSLEFKLVDPSGNESGTLSSTHNKLTGVLGGNPYFLDLQVFSPENGDSRLSLKIIKEDGIRGIQAGSWQLIILGVNVLSDKHHIDLWIETTSGGPFIQFSDGEPNGTLTIPGTAESVITVGACECSDPVMLLESSSRGPTRGEPFYKPDLCAPGRDIHAPRFDLNSDSGYIAKSGTSMAAPHVTGALALVLSHRHKTNPEAMFNSVQLKKALKLTLLNRNVKHDAGMGWGVLDALHLYQHLENLP